ncbi:MAG: hypothetical protein HY917_02535, partial [Candidatus Diapherotrites archaeon]|nr:hypothetical protein [Candidatus Diapherotrites archaeon]
MPKTVELPRVQSGIPGFDPLVGGGIPQGNLVALSGDPGSGKTVFSWQFLYEGAIHQNEPGVYVSLEEPIEFIIQGAKEFGMDFEE